jgi:tRNA(Ile)-lysidine synthase
MGPTDPVTEFEKAVRRNLHRCGGVGKGVVAVSGGADSVALLMALANDPQSTGVVVAHLNHQLRGADSDADAAFVADLCPHLPHHIQSIAVREIARGDNLEAVARAGRYAFLKRVAIENDARWIATAHTLNDQAETVLHRLIRGTGLRGLRGIAEHREVEPGIRLIRPMLTVSRTEVIAYLRAMNQPWREDATNRDVAFTRNRIRHELLPLLTSFNPSIAESLARTASQAEEVYSEIEREASDALTDAELPRAGRVVVLDAASMLDSADFRIRELFHLLWQREGWQVGDMTHEHWQRLVDVVKGRARTWDLPGNLRIVGMPRVVRIGPAAELST